MRPKETAKRNADPKRKDAFLRGVSAEGRASLYLAAKGYRTEGIHQKSGSKRIGCAERSSARGFQQ